MDYFIPAVVSTILLVIAVYLLVKTIIQKNANDAFYKERLEEKDRWRKEEKNDYKKNIENLRAEYEARCAIVRVGDKERFPHPTDTDLAFVEKELVRKGFDPEKVLVVPWHLTFDTIQTLANARKFSNDSSKAIP